MCRGICLFFPGYSVGVVRVYVTSHMLPSSCGNLKINCEMQGAALKGYILSWSSACLWPEKGNLEPSVPVSSLAQLREQRGMEHLMLPHCPTLGCWAGGGCGELAAGSRAGMCCEGDGFFMEGLHWKLFSPFQGCCIPCGAFLPV